MFEIMILIKYDFVKDYNKKYKTGDVGFIRSFCFVSGFTLFAAPFTLHICCSESNFIGKAELFILF